MKNKLFKKMIVFIFILTIVFNCTVVYADDEPSISSTWQGSAEGYKSKSSSDDSVVNDGKKCGEDVLCFSGNGLFIKLLKYDPITKNVEVVGRPVFLYNGKMIDKASVIRTEAEEAVRIDTNEWNKTECLWSIDLEYGYEEIEIYEKENITICAGDGYSCSTFPFSSLKMIKRSELPDITSGTVPEYIKNSLLNEFGNPTAMMSNFNATIDYSELSRYYLAFEVAGRVKGDIKTTYTDEKTSYSVTFPFRVNRYVCSVDSSKVGMLPYTWVTSCKKTKTGSCSLVNEQYQCSYGGTYATQSACNNDCKKTTRGTWDVDGCYTPDFVLNSTLYTKIYEGKSKILPARQTSKNKLIAGLVTAKNNTLCVDGAVGCVMHNVYDQEGNVTGQEYYIGPSLKEAMVGTSSYNKYLLWDMSKPAPGKKEANEGYAVGVSYWWLQSLPEFSCTSVCKNISGDELLKCAENYCDNLIGYDERMNTQKSKASCMTGMCGYEYTPVSCSNANPYLNAEAESAPVNANTECNLVGGGSLESQDNKRIITSCNTLGVDTDVFDAKTYINVACKETSSFKYSDLKGVSTSAGKGIDYSVKLNGKKECTVFFDLESWKFAYASYHSKDMIELDDGRKVSSRQLLLDMLTYFNESLEKGSESTSLGINMDGSELPETWEGLNYDLNNVKVTTQVQEIVNNEKKLSDVYELKINDSSGKLENQRTTTKTEETLTFANLVSKKVYLNKYVRTSAANNVTYTFDKYCIDDPATGKISLAPANGICSTNGTDIEYGKNVYYTNLNATPNIKFTNSSFEHSFNKTIATIKDSNTNTDYLVDNEHCPYEIGEGPLSCDIKVEPYGGTEMDCDNVFSNGSVQAELIVNNLSGDMISETSIKSSYNDMDPEVIIINPKGNGVEEVEIVGNVVIQKDRTATCKASIKFVKSSNVCTIQKSGDTLFEVNVSGTPSKVEYALSSDFDWKVIGKDINTGKYLINTKDTDFSGTIYARVNGSSICKLSQCAGPNCYTTYKPSRVGDIRKYCETNYKEDVNNFDDVDDCIIKCAAHCPLKRNDLTVVTNFCNANALLLGYKNVSNCINYCYDGGYSGEYIYRPVNNYNPFPNSYDSAEFGYPVGERQIGKNWVGKSHYIKRDDDDETSVTGALRNQSYEYVIELTPNDIRAIRSNTEEYNSTTSGNDAYLDYVYMDGVDNTKEYYSKFINETMYEKFSVIRGVRVK